MAFIFFSGLHLLSGNCITSLHVLKYSLQYSEVRIFTLLSPKISHETQIIQHLTHFEPTPDIKWLIHYPKKGILK